MKHKGKKKPTTFSPAFYLFTVSLALWFHMLLCNKELYRSATEDYRKCLCFICTSPVQVTVTANFSCCFRLYTWNWKFSWSEICYCEKGGSIIGMNTEDYFHWCIHYTIVYDTGTTRIKTVKSLSDEKQSLLAMNLPSSSTNSSCRSTQYWRLSWKFSDKIPYRKLTQL